VQLWPRAWPIDALRLSGRAGWLSAASKVTLTGAPRESEVLFARNSPATSVEIDGRQVQRFASVAALRSAREGWVWNTSPFPGVLVKVAPNRGAASVSVR
jgi:hypothetical protein